MSTWQISPYSSSFSLSLFPILFPLYSSRQAPFGGSSLPSNLVAAPLSLTQTPFLSSQLLYLVAIVSLLQWPSMIGANDSSSTNTCRRERFKGAEMSGARSTRANWRRWHVQRVLLSCVFTVQRHRSPATLPAHLGAKMLSTLHSSKQYSAFPTKCPNHWYAFSCKK